VQKAGGVIEHLKNWAIAFGPSIIIGAFVAYLVHRWFRLHIVWVILAGVLVALVLGYPIKTNAVRLTMPSVESH
jgi:hypothetical protein